MLDVCERFVIADGLIKNSLGYVIKGFHTLSISFIFFQTPSKPNKTFPTWLPSPSQLDYQQKGSLGKLERRIQSTLSGF